jgi:hypothetical protein
MTKRNQSAGGSGELSAMSCPLQWSLVDTHFVETAARSRRALRTTKKKYKDGGSGELTAMGGPP